MKLTMLELLPERETHLFVGEMQVKVVLGHFLFLWTASSP